MNAIDLIQFSFYQIDKRLFYFENAHGIKRNSIRKIGNKEIRSAEDGNNALADLILSGEPFMAARFGTVEMGTINRYVANQLGLPSKYSREIYTNAGVFPFDKTICDRFCELMIDCSKYVDCLYLLEPMNERYAIKHFTNCAELFKFRGLEPYYFDYPWSRMLFGRKVLVIHPFSESIKSQYKIKNHLFKNEMILPDFQLITYQSVQSIAGNKTAYNNWFEAMDKMTNDIEEIDFDIAIIGCGAYGFPLAARIKNMGKQAIHMGGATQILFGIIGSRWENNEVKSLINPFWKRPYENECPPHADTVEGGCYW